MQRVTLDGTKIKANASGNTFRRKEKIEAHLALARKQVQEMNAQAAEEEKAPNAKPLPSAAPGGNGSVAWRRRFVKWSGCRRAANTIATT
jgi:hypothetical protein